MVINLDAGDTEDLPIKFLIALEHNMMAISCLGAAAV